MKYVLAAILLSTLAVAQIQTTCTTSGNTTNCTSYDYGAQQKQAYDAGRNVGLAMQKLSAEHKERKAQREQLRSESLDTMTKMQDDFAHYFVLSLNPATTLPYDKEEAHLHFGNLRTIYCSNGGKDYPELEGGIGHCSTHRPPSRTSELHATDHSGKP